MYRRSDRAESADRRYDVPASYVGNRFVRSDGGAIPVGDRELAGVTAEEGVAGAGDVYVPDRDDPADTDRYGHDFNESPFGDDEVDVGRVPSVPRFRRARRIRPQDHRKELDLDDEDLLLILLLALLAGGENCGEVIAALGMLLTVR